MGKDRHHVYHLVQYGAGLFLLYYLNCMLVSVNYENIKL